MFGEKKPVLSCRVLAKRTNHLSRRGKKISFLSHLLFPRSVSSSSHGADDVTGSLAERRTEMFLRIKIRKNRVAVNFLVYRFPVNKCFNVSPYRTPNRSSSSFLHPLIIISPPLSSRFLQFFFSIKISIKNFHDFLIITYSYNLIYLRALVG